MPFGTLATQLPDQPAQSAWANQVKANFEATLGGDLAGTLPNPTIAASAVSTAKLADNAVTAAKIAALNVTTAKIADLAVTTGKLADLAVTDAKVAAANKDGAAGTPSLRTLGTGAAQAAAGNDARLSDTRTPTDGSVTATKIAALAITDAHVAAANKDGAAGTPSLRTLGTSATSACAGNDARLSNARTPTGAAGGVLSGTYPNPTLGAITPAPGIRPITGGYSASLAADASTGVVATSGLLIVSDTADDYVGLFVLNGQTGGLSLVSDPGARFAVGSGSPGDNRIRVYVSLGTYYIVNRFGSARAVAWTVVHAT